MKDNKDFKEEKYNTTMGKGYKTYAEAIRNCRSDEITIYNQETGLYYNIKVISKPKKNIWGLGSQW